MLVDHKICPFEIVENHYTRLRSEQFERPEMKDAQPIKISTDDKGATNYKTLRWAAHELTP